MNVEQIAFDQIAKTIGSLFHRIYYVDIESGSFCEFIVSKKADIVTPEAPLSQFI